MPAVDTREMHPATLRLYQVVQHLCGLDDLPQPSRVAAEANISQQTLKHWEGRGPSAQGLLDFQQAHSVNATWLLTGHGPQMIDERRLQHQVAEAAPVYRAWPLSQELLKCIGALDPAARLRVENSIRAQLDMAALPVAGNRAAA